MNRRRTCVLAAASAVLAAAGVAGSAGASADSGERDVINKMDGSRLATYGDGLGEGASAVSLRAPSWNHRSEAWRIEQVGREYGALGSGADVVVFRNVAANKCLQPATPNPNRGTGVVIKTCDGSDLQKWVAREPRGNSSHWRMFTPKTNKDVALALNGYSSSWSTVHLERAYPSSDRLWHIAPNDQSWQ